MKRLFTISILLINCFVVFAHSGYQQHCNEMISVFGIDPNANPDIYKWAKYISSDMIDNHQPFYNNLKAKHPGFTCKHRLLFHWGYNSRPWSNAIEYKVKRYCKDVNAQSVNDTIILFKNELIAEQKRRNRLVNEKTETLFGFGQGGMEAVFANRFASIAYNIHLLGDYTSDNSDLDGVIPVNELIGAIITDIRTLDNVESKDIIKGITKINNQIPDTQLKADALMLYLQNEMPDFIKNMREGSVFRRLKSRKIIFLD